MISLHDSLFTTFTTVDMMIHSKIHAKPNDKHTDEQDALNAQYQ